MPRLKDVIDNFDGREWLEVALDKYDQTTLREPKVRDYFSPSSVHWCPRAIWYHMKGYEQDPIKANSVRRMMAGTVYHEFIDDMVGNITLYTNLRLNQWQNQKIKNIYSIYLSMNI